MTYGCLKRVKEHSGPKTTCNEKVVPCNQTFCSNITIVHPSNGTALSEGLAHSTVHNHHRQLPVYLRSGALIFFSELPGVI